MNSNLRHNNCNGAKTMDTIYFVYMNDLNQIARYQENIKFTNINNIHELPYIVSL